MSQDMPRDRDPQNRPSGGAVDPSQMSLDELFRLEAQTQAQALSDGLLILERTPDDAATLEACMRAAHSLKGAARIVGVPTGLAIAHAMEDSFVAAQRGALRLTPAHIDILLHGVDLLTRLGGAEQADAAEADRFVQRLNTSAPVPPASRRDERRIAPNDAPARAEATAGRAAAAVAPSGYATPAASIGPATATPGNEPERSLRVSAERLDRLLRRAGESLVESRWLQPFSESMRRVKRSQREVSRSFDALAVHLRGEPSAPPDPVVLAALDQLRHAVERSEGLLNERLAEVDVHERRTSALAQRVYEEALACRMRPFSDSTGGYARMVRDLGRALGKDVQLEIVGAATPVDRDILDLLDAPLGHLLRNAVDHGIESAAARQAIGKGATGRVTLDARHRAGKLLITVADDGGGIDLERVRRAVIERGLASTTTVMQLSEAELLDFLLLPGFTLSQRVTDVSGRGVGLDAVHDMIKRVRGSLRISQLRGHGTRFTLELPLTRSVARSLLVEIGGEPYALPLASVQRTYRLAPHEIASLEGREHFLHEGKRLGLVDARQVFGVAGGRVHDAAVHVLVLGDAHGDYGLAVDNFIGERMLVVHPLDPRLGKIKDIAAGSIMENGDPVLIVDVDDLIRSIQRLAADGRIERLGRNEAETRAGVSARRVLVVEDSLTVRELERKLLTAHGYEVVIAVDGMDGWNAVRSGQFDLVVTDVDMPRMDGIELVQLIKGDTRLARLPVMIVSYKDRPEDRQRGLEAGADYYLAKASFHDAALLDAVRDLIGEARA
ncbi:MAG: hybrid sensor histidine kinase/response regulator [Janthinobacterium lividum]